MSKQNTNQSVPLWKVQEATKAHEPLLKQLLYAQTEFTPQEVDCALEVIVEAILHPGKDYHLLVCVSENELGGYICYGRTPMTDNSWDLYWVLTHPDFRRQKIGSLLVDAMEKEISRSELAIIRVETSSKESHGAAMRFYEKHGYQLACQIADFYRTDDDLILFFKRIESLSTL